MKNIKNEKDTEENKLNNVEQQEKIQKEQVKSENKILKGFFIAIISFAVMFMIISLIINAVNHFNYKEIGFNIDKNEIKGKILYRTSIPVKYPDSITGKIISADYNFWLRNDPRELDKNVPIINGNLEFRKNIVLDLTTKDLFCEGDWNIGLQNSVNLLQILGFNVIVKNETSKYEPINEFMFITIQIGNSTNIERKFATINLKGSEVEIKDENSYNLNINNCEVIPAFERLMLEAFVKYAEGVD